MDDKELKQWDLVPAGWTHKVHGEKDNYYKDGVLRSFNALGEEEECIDIKEMMRNG